MNRKAVMILVVLSVLVLGQASAQTVYTVPAGAAIQQIELGAEDVAYTYTLPDEDGIYLGRGTTSYGPYESVVALEWAADGRTLFHYVSDGPAKQLYRDGVLVAALENAQWMAYRLPPTGDGFLVYGPEGNVLVAQYRDTRIELTDRPDLLSPGFGVHGLHWAPDGSTAYFVFSLPSFSKLYEGTTVIDEHDWIRDIDMNPDGRLVYNAVDDRAWHLYRDGEREGPIAGGAMQVQWSPDGRRVAYRTGDNNGPNTVVQGGTEIGTFRAVRRFQWHPFGDSLVFTYGGRDEDKYLHVRNTDLGPYSDILAIAWSSDGTEMAFAAKDAEPPHALYVYAGDERYGPYSHERDYTFSSLSWSPNGESLAYADYDAGVTTLYLNGEAVVTSRASIRPLLWSDDGRALEFGQGYGPEPTRVLIDGREFAGSIFGSSIARLEDSRIVLE